jgi:hypothetical protein
LTIASDAALAVAENKPAATSDSFNDLVNFVINVTPIFDLA